MLLLLLDRPLRMARILVRASLGMILRVRVWDQECHWRLKSTPLL